MILKTVFLFGILTLLSCRSDTEQPDYGVITTTGEAQEIIHTDKAEGEIRFQDLVKTCKVVPLKVMDDEFIVEADKVVRFRDEYYLLDAKQSKLFVFDQQGKFVKKIGQRGSAPGEYQSLDDIIINQNAGQIILLSNADFAIHKYDLSGRYIKDVRLPFAPSSFALVNDTTLAIFTGYYEEDFFNVVLTDLNGQVRYKAFPFPKETTPMEFAFTGALRNSNGKVYYTDATSSVINEFDESVNNFIPRYRIVISNNTWPEEDKLNFDKFARAIMKIGEVSFLQDKYYLNDQVIVFNYLDGADNRNGFYFLKSKNLYNDHNIQDDALYSLFKYTPPIGCTPDGSFIFLLDYELCSYVRSRFDDDISETLSAVDASLANAVEELTETDNPILLEINFKDGALSE